MLDVVAIWVCGGLLLSWIGLCVYSITIHPASDLGESRGRGRTPAQPAVAFAARPAWIEDGTETGEQPIEITSGNYSSTPSVRHCPG